MLGVRCARTAIKCLLISKLIRKVSGLRTVFFAVAYISLILVAPFNRVAEAQAPVIAQADLERYREVAQLKKFLAKYDSPLTPYSEKFVDVAARYGLDWRLLPAIAGTESIFGKAYVAGTYNPFGWGNGYIYFASWEDGIEVVGKGLGENYKGATNLDIESVGRTYAESQRWPRSVRFWLGKIETN